MKKSKKIKTAVIVAAAVTGVAGGSVAGVNYIRKNNSKSVEVLPVSALNAGDMSMNSDDSTSGTVVSNVSQNVRIPDGKVIDQVYVKEGDKVKIGDKLLSYDTTLLELDQELQEITVMELGLEIKSAEADLAKLQNAKPGDAILDNLSSDGGSSLIDDTGDDSSDDDAGSGEEEARLISNSRELLASQEDGTEADTENTATESEPETESVSDTESAVTENTPETESEVIIDQGDDVSNEVLTPDQLDQAGKDTQASEDTTGTEETEQEKSKKDQSLEKLFTNVRIKAVTENGEDLLADISQKEEDTVQIENTVKVIPHFRETAEEHFKITDTYTMLIHGVTLKQQIEGKVYGTAKINGEDYPEIGGFILAQKNGNTDTAQLTIAFHDGLDQQHEVMPELEDMYLELNLQKDEITGDNLIFRTGDESKDAVITVEKQEEQTEETEASESSTDTSGIEWQDLTDNTQQINTGNEEEQTQEVETETESETEEETEETETETESETESDIISQQNFALQKIHFQIEWDHGTDAKENWPFSMKAYFYKKGVSSQEDADCSFTLTQGSSVAAGKDSGVDGTDTDIAEEVTTEPTVEYTTEAVTGDGETEAAVSTETEEQTEEATSATEQIPDTDAVSSKENWKTIDLVIPEDVTISSEEVGTDKSQWSERWSGYAPNYSMEIKDVQPDSSDASVTVVMKMTYTQPADSPLIKLNPISELTWQHGMNTLNETGMRAYKGSGTAEEPYVFFVTDGVKITNTFVNWVLGFNEEGTKRISDGYYIRLEIRESNTITGAFIRSIDLDGTVLTDHGYGPGTYWIFSSDTGITKYEEDIPEDEPSIPDGPGGWDNDNDGTGYTAEELAQAIEDKKLEIQKLKLDERQAKLKLKDYNKQMDASTVVSSVDGYIKSINGSDDDAYMVVESENGLYVKTSVSELNLDNVAIDQVIKCESYYTGEQFTATITEIDSFPSDDDSGSYWGSSGNVNSSNYPVLAVVDTDAEDGLSEYDDVSVTYPATSTVSSGSIYLEKAYIRSENGQSYVYAVDENDKLKKQYIRTGATVWGYVEVKQGLSTDDQIAFPYGKSVKEGAAVKLASEYE